MKSDSIRVSALFLSLSAAVMLAACGGKPDKTGTTSGALSTLQGHVSSDTSGSGTSAYDSSGTLQAATAVQLQSISSNGSLSVVGTGTIDATGAYTVQAPPAGQKLVVQALDSKEHVLASAVVESTGVAGQTITVAPMTTRTSVEAAVMVRMVVQGATLADIDTVDLYQRINAPTAAAVRTLAEAGTAVDAELRVLADAASASQLAVIQSYGQSGVMVTGSALFADKLSLAQTFDVGLDANTEVAASEDADLATHVATGLNSSGMNAQVQAMAALSSSAAFRGVLSAELGASVADQPLVAAGSVAQGWLEARAAASAETFILTTAGAEQATIDLATAAGAALQTSVTASTTTAGVSAAFVTFQADMATSTAATSSPTVLGQLLGTSAGATAELTALLAAEVKLQATLQGSLTTTFPATTGSVSTTASATGVVTAYGTFSSGTDVQARLALVGLDAVADTSAQVLVIADGAFVTVI